MIYYLYNIENISEIFEILLTGSVIYDNPGLGESPL